ncbi:MAG: holo-ACP synthase [Candidatus Magasanikbacteria bacterium]|nr:holo-ACP synthase [Candidatus Magasanikbacteria bacterium]
MQGIGIDIVEVERFKKIASLSRFLEFVFLPEEMKVLEEKTDKFAYISSRFAAKEAVIKAMPLPVSMHDFEIKKDGLKPTVVFLNEKLRKFTAQVSLSHSDTHAAAVAIVE